MDKHQLPFMHVVFTLIAPDLQVAYGVQQHNNHPHCSLHNKSIST